MGCVKEIQKHQLLQEIPKQVTEQLPELASEESSELKQNQKRQMDSKGSLLLTKTMISLDQILSLVPEFKK